ncbi:MAG: anaerobic glycerol-3-phosphate dehydrogenase subunit C, partial [Planctomycetota bacterium]
VEDIAVPPDALPDFIKRSQDILKRHQVIASLFAHAGHGQLHLRPFLNLANPDDVNRMQRLATDLYEIVLDANGTIAGEHGNGLSRSWFVRKQYPRLYPVFRELKRIFDPVGILNPGKVTESEPLQLMKSLRPVTVAPPRPDKVTEPGAAVETEPEMGDAASKSDKTQEANGALDLLLNWNETEVALAARSCNGCGSCRTQGSAMRMCPIFRFAPAEEASPRAKANMMRGIFTGTISPEQLADDELKQVADLCVNCHQCRDECPAGVDIPKLMIEYKAQYVATNGLTFSDWILSRLDLLAPIASRLRPFANYAIGNRRMRWLLERITGLAQGRKLPRIATRPFLAIAKRRRLTRPERSGGQKVLYFTDLYANWFDLDIAEAFVHVFQHNGVSVYVPPTQIQSGMSLIAIGAIEKAKELAATNIAMLADAVRQGYHIVTAEPSAALCLTREYPNMFDDDDVRLISENTSEACSYLWRMHQRGQLELDFKPLNLTVGYHLPCHSRALGEGTPAEHLLRLIPGLVVRSLDKGCSGMAGTYGLKRENYRNSLRAGWPLISAIREPSLHVGATECSTCKMQMEQGTSKPTVHPLKLLAFAYGVMPEVSNAINHTGEELFVS